MYMQMHMSVYVCSCMCVYKCISFDCTLWIYGHCQKELKSLNDDKKEQPVQLS